MSHLGAGREGGERKRETKNGACKIHVLSPRHTPTLSKTVAATQNDLRRRDIVSGLCYIQRHAKNAPSRNVMCPRGDTFLWEATARLRRCGTQRPETDLLCENDLHSTHLLGGDEQMVKNAQHKRFDVYDCVTSSECITGNVPKRTRARAHAKSELSHFVQFNMHAAPNPNARKSAADSACKHLSSNEKKLVWPRVPEIRNVAPAAGGTARYTLFSANKYAIRTSAFAPLRSKTKKAPAGPIARAVQTNTRRRRTSAAAIRVRETK